MPWIGICYWAKDWFNDYYWSSPSLVILADGSLTDPICGDCWLMDVFAAIYPYKGTYPGIGPGNGTGYNMKYCCYWLC